MVGKQGMVSVKWASVTIGVLLIVIGISIVALSQRPKREIVDFEGCVRAGGVIMETYPEQCRIDDDIYINESQRRSEYPPDEKPPADYWYIGLSEDEALARAEKENTPARVVERDGEALPVTMDFVYDRLNLYVKDNTVVKVEVEGQAIDAN